MADAAQRWTGPRAVSEEEAGREALATSQRQHELAIGDATPLGLVAFATSAFTMGSVLAGWWPRPLLQLLAVVPLLIVFGGITQFIAAMWGYARGQTLPATFFGAFGSFFAAVGIYELVVARAAVAAGPVVGPGAAGAALTVLGPLGVIVGCFAFIALFVTIGSAFTNAGLSATSLALTCALLLLAWAFFARGNTVLEAISGWFAIVSGFLAFVTAAVMSVGGGMARFLTLGGRGQRPWLARS